MMVWLTTTISAFVWFQVEYRCVHCQVNLQSSVGVTKWLVMICARPVLCSVGLMCMAVYL